MNATQTAIEVSRKIASTNPAGVGALFQRYGIKAPPTGQNLFLAMIKYKKPFVNDLYDQIAFSNATGTDEAEKGKFFTLMNNILSTASNTMDVLNKAQGGQNATPQLPAAQLNPAPPAAKNNQLLIYGGIAVAVLLIIVLILRKK